MLYRLSSIVLAEPQVIEESYVLKVGQVSLKLDADLNKEAKFLLKVGSLYTNPIFPKLHFSASSSIP